MFGQDRAMQKIKFSDPKKAMAELKAGRRIGLFALDATGAPTQSLGALFVEPQDKPIKPKSVIRPAAKYIDDHYAQTVRLAHLAKLCGITPNYLCRAFRKQYGKSVIARVTELRMDRACRLLGETDEPVVRIAYESGYSDCAYFHKVFKKHVGCAPLEYRRLPRFPAREPRRAIPARASHSSDRGS